MQQNIINILLSSVLGFFLSTYWMLKEIRFVSTMHEFEQDITWLVQAPLMIFIAILILLSLMLFIGSIGSFSFSDFKEEVPWKKLLVNILVFDVVLLVLTLLNAYFELTDILFSQIIVLIVLVIFYIYGVVKYKINPIFFLVSLCLISSVFLYIIFGVN